MKLQIHGKEYEIEIVEQKHKNTFKVATVVDNVRLGFLPESRSNKIDAINYAIGYLSNKEETKQ